MRLRRGGHWHPAGTERSGLDRPVVGEMVAWERRAWLVTHVRVNDPTERDAERLKHYKPEYRDRHAPYSISLQRVHGPKHERENSRQEIALSLPALAMFHWERYDEGRVPLCSCCNHPWPCLMVDAKKDAEHSARLLDERITRAGVGLCYSCGEVITHRQGSVTYPEGNVDLPGYPAPRFHTRKSCFSGRYSYEKRRAEAYPDTPSLIESEREGGLL